MSSLDSVLSSYAKRRGFSSSALNDDDGDDDDDNDNNEILQPSSGVKISENSCANSNFVFLLTKFDVSAELESYIKFLKTLSSERLQQLSPLNRIIIDEIRAFKFEFQDRQLLIFNELFNYASGDYTVSCNDQNVIYFIENEDLCNSLSNFVKRSNAYFLSTVFEKVVKVRITAETSNIPEDDKEDENEIDWQHPVDYSAVILPPEAFFVQANYPNLCSLFETAAKPPTVKIRSINKDILFCYSLNFKNDISSVDLSPDRSNLIGGTNSGRIYLWSLKSNADSSICMYSSSAVNCIKFLSTTNISDECIVLSGCEDGSVRLWRISKNNDRGRNSNFYTYSTHTYPIMNLDTDSDNQFFLAASYNATICLFAYENLHPLRILAGHSDSVQSATFLSRMTPTGRNLIGSASMDSTVRVWSPEHSLPVRIYHLPSSSYPTVIKSVPFSHNGLLCGTVDRKLLFYDFRKGNDDAALQTIDLQDTVPYAVDFDSTDRSLYVAGSNGVVKIFDWDTSGCKFVENPCSTFGINAGGDCVVCCLRVPTNEYSHLACVATDNGSYS